MTTTKQIGSGRPYWQRPTEPGPELTLYEATHADTSWEHPAPADVAALIRWYRTLPGCEVGGSLHIVIDDGNDEDEYLHWCAGYASGVGDACGSELAGLLLRMNERDRAEAIELA